jgi:hypothetical protein
MPHDDQPLELNPARAPTATPTLEVMTRVLRLPTRAPRQARAIVRMQLDRLSPLPAADTLFDLVALRQDGAETVYALGILRRAALADPGFANERTVTASRSVESENVVFRFRNAGAVDDREARWLKHAPRAALVCLGLAAVALAGQLRADQWRERRLPEIAAEKRLALQQARLAEQQASARADWVSLERADAATRYLCVAGQIGAALPGGLAVTSAAADPHTVTLTVGPGSNLPALVAAGATPQIGRSSSAAGTVVFPSEVCA